MNYGKKDFIADLGLNYNWNSQPIARLTSEEPSLFGTAKEGEFVLSPLKYELNNIDSIESLRLKMTEFKDCPLYQTATNMVFADGNPESPIMLIGEAPGEEEDLQGKPFVGASGKLLTKMFQAIALERSEIYITNNIPYRPPKNRNPTKEELAAFRPFLYKHLELAKAKVLILVGGVATQNVLETDLGIMKLRGNWYRLNYKNRSWVVRAILHPAYLMRNPYHKKLAWLDMLDIKQEVDKWNS